MRRTQIAGGAKDKAAEDGRMSTRELISFDLKRMLEPEDLALAERRVAMFKHAPMLMAAGHAIWGVSLLAQCICENFFVQMLGPMLLLALYTFVFAVVFQARWPGPAQGSGHFALTLFAGLMR